MFCIICLFGCSLLNVVSGVPFVCSYLCAFLVCQFVRWFLVMLSCLLVSLVLADCLVGSFAGFVSWVGVLAWVGDLLTLLVGVVGSGWSGRLGVLGSLFAGLL